MERQYNNLLFEWNEETNGWKLKKCINNPRKVEVPSKIDSKPVTMIGEYAFINVKSADIQGISAMIRDSEYDTPSLDYIRIPESVKIINYCAFYGCTELEYIDLPDKIDEIRAGAFCFCESLKEIHIPNGIGRISRITFRGCSSLRLAVIPKSVEEIEFSAFEDCDSLERVEICGNVREIGNRAFWGCYSLENINLPESLEKIGDGCFAKNSFEEIKIPEKVKSLSANVFRECVCLNRIYVSSFSIFDENTDDRIKNAAVCDNVILNDTETKYRPEKWIHRYTGSDTSKIKLICFHYAGGNASWYDSWCEKNDGFFEIYPVQLPMRSERIDESMPDTMEELAEEFIRECIPLFKEPFVLFGHSMGAQLAYETACQLKVNYGISPLLLVISACGAPIRAERELNGYSAKTVSEEKLIQILTDYAQTDSLLLEYLEFREYYLPIVRQDFFLCENYCKPPEKIISSPVYVFRGNNDFSVTYESSEKWKAYTSGECKQFVFDGNHFYAEDYVEKILEVIKEKVIGEM